MGFGNDDDAGCIFVQPVNNAGAMFAANAFQVRAMVQDTVHQCSGCMAGCRVNHQSRGLVDDDNMWIFVENIQWYGLRNEFNRAGFGDLNSDLFPGFDFVPGFDTSPINLNTALTNQLGSK